jgi:hypothetical protein
MRSDGGRGAQSGPKMTEAEITKVVTNYSGGSKPKSKPVDMSRTAKNRRDTEYHR